MMNHYFVTVFLFLFLLFGIPSSFSLDFSNSEDLQTENQNNDQQTQKTEEVDEAKEWISLFDGKSLTPWVDSGFVGGGKIEVVDEAIQLGTGVMGTAIRYEKEGEPFPQMNYEIEYEARRMSGVDFFAALTFPVGETFCSFINGGWGGTVVGISCIDGFDASENSYSKYLAFKDKIWYKFRILVVPDRIIVWIDDQEVINVPLEDHLLSTRIEVEYCKPIGFSSWVTSGQIRNIRYRLINNEQHSN
ncbi:MAG: DUF1080 domain-containing protein [Planctomycetia bacterium]|nr:DUF1080 domain-containing protein [Planctomycetia bacterium]